MQKVKKLAAIGKDCVACGCCVRVCPREAIQVPFGVTAVVDSDKCVGCGRCAAECPAGIISLKAAEGEK